MLSPSKIMIDAPDNNDETDAIGDRPINHEVVTQIAAGRGQSYFLTESGHVYASGTNFNGQLCLGHRDDMPLPTLVAGVDNYLEAGNDFSLLDEGVKVKQIAAGRSSLYVLLSNGQMLSCGKNIHGQLGLGVVDRDVDTPTVMNVAKSTRVFSSSTSFGAFFVNDDATIYRVGFGSGARENWRSPDVVACPDGEFGSTEVEIAAGNDHALYLAQVDTSFDCTKNNDEEIPDEMTDSNSPTSAKPSAPTISPKPPRGDEEYLEPLSGSDDAYLFADGKRPQAFSTAPSASMPPTLQEKNQPTDSSQNQRSGARRPGLSRVATSFAVVLVSSQWLTS